MKPATRHKLPNNLEFEKCYSNNDKAISRTSVTTNTEFGMEHESYGGNLKLEQHSGIVSKCWWLLSKSVKHTFTLFVGKQHKHKWEWNV